jgi:hypothetical protein
MPPFETIWCKRSAWQTRGRLESEAIRDMILFSLLWPEGNLDNSEKRMIDR